MFGKSNSENGGVDNQLNFTSKNMEFTTYDDSDTSTLRQRIKQLEMQLAASKVTVLAT